MSYNTDLSKTASNIDPDAVVFTVTSKKVTQFFSNVFQSKVDGFKTVRFFVKKTSSGSQISAYAFVDANTNAVRTNRNNANSQDISPVFRNKLETETTVSEDLKRVFRPFSYENGPRCSIKGQGGQRMLCIELDPFALLGLMLSVEKSTQEIIITHLETIDRRTNEIAIRCVKRYRNVASDRDFNDVYNEIYRNQLSRNN